MSRESQFRLKSCPKHYTYDQDKTIDPLETVKNASSRLNKMFDLSSFRVEARADAIEGAYSFSSVSDQFNASGKGLTPEQSQASAVMEFAERYSWLHYDYKHADGYALKSFNEVKQGDTPTVDQSYFLANLVEQQKKEAQYLDEIKAIPMKWVKGVSLLDYKKFYYPINWHNYFFTSNGLATGNAMEEAIVQALCEVIERENIYRLFVEQQMPNDLDQGSLKHPLITRVLENSEKKGIKFTIKDISYDLGVPTFIACGVSQADEGTLIHKGCGQGTHPNPEKALIRALSEYFESYSLLKKRVKDVDVDWRPILPRLEKKYTGFLPLYNPGILDQRKKVVKLKDLPDLSRNDIKDEIDHILGVLKKRGYNVIFIDKTHPELQVPVPRIFVPGFRSVISTETEDPLFIMSRAYFEAGDAEIAQELFDRSFLKSAFFMPEMAGKTKVKKVFKKDYQQNIIAFGGYKKSSVDKLKTLLKVYRFLGGKM
ncbi:YcaO-like family protein [Candidatus Margulisiibacteriota bacterium]